ncbi:MAG: PAS domain-containing protein [Anaerolineales bacterium]|nr:PAS domain-containing protein [Anaerolineales bacterium]
MLRSIRWRIGLSYALLILASIAGLGVYLSNFVRQNYLSNLEAQLTSEVLLASEIVQDQILSGATAEELDILAQRWAEKLGARLTIIAADGIVIGESDEDRLQMDNHLTRPEIVQAEQDGKGISTRYSRTVGDYLMYVAVPVKSDIATIAFVRIALPLGHVEDQISSLQRTLLTATLLIILAAILLAFILTRFSLQPLRDLTFAATQIATGKLDAVRLGSPLTHIPNDEINQLTASFKNMAVQLKTQLEALETERSKMAAVLRVMSDGVMIVDNEGMVRLMNPAAEAIFDIRLGEATGHSVAEVLRHHQLFELWQRCHELDSVQTATVDLAPRHLHLQVTATPLDSSLPGYILLLFQNLTRLRRLETIRQDFISNISHELRTPLASLKALTETLSESALEDPPAARRFLQRMETEVDSLSQMVTELLELSRIESGRVPLQLSPVVPLELVHQAVERLRLQAERVNLTVQITCPEDLPAVLADAKRLEQVLVNLLHNAIKFTPPGGRIEVRARQQENQVLFTIQDSGVGIPAIDLPRIFERFYKADRARSGGGTGLGLAISRHLVEAHGGKIWAESVEGQGSSFNFFIPMAVDEPND